MNDSIRKWILSIFFIVIAASELFADINQTLEGQLSGLANDIREILQNERILDGNRKLKLDPPSADGMDDHLTPFFEQALRTRLDDILDDSSSLRLKVSYAYIESELPKSKGKRVIQLVAKIFDKGRPIQLPPRNGDRSVLPEEQIRTLCCGGRQIEIPFGQNYVAVQVFVEPEPQSIVSVRYGPHPK